MELLISDTLSWTTFFSHKLWNILLQIKRGYFFFEKANIYQKKTWFQLADRLISLIIASIYTQSFYLEYEI
jgi:hypothetical protein